MIPTIKTDRLILRPWAEADFAPFASLNADPAVMEYFPALMTRKESDQFANKIMIAMKKQGWGLWAVAVPGICDFIGYIGLAPVDFPANFTPAIEIGWRLAYGHWNRGYATEGAQAVMRFAFERLGLQEIVSFTAFDNSRSRNVMEKIGMHHDPSEDFDHPKLPLGHKLRRHVLYRMNKTSPYSYVWKTPPENFQPSLEAAACYVDIEGKLLLLERSAHKSEGLTWGVPGGKIEKGELPVEAAMRELFEETNIVITSSNIKELGKLYIEKPAISYVYHLFQVKLDTIPQVVLNDENTRFLWLSDQEIRKLPLILGAIQALTYYREMKES
jgi:RimJ/RimL family protein N-acetyltransferase/8-oxo-dGTP pyrophosphatase MutT (NUDIX family)